MSARTTSAVRFARLGIAAALVVLLAAVAVRFIPRRRPPISHEPGKSVPEAMKVDRKENIRHREFKDGKVWDDLRADRFFLGEDGLNHLEGSVEIIDYGRAEGRETRISAASVAYDKEMIHFRMTGRVKVKAKDLTFESESIEYDKATGLYRTDQGGVLGSDRLAGSGRTFVYDEKRNEVRLSGGFRFEVKAGPPSSGAGTITGDALVYDRSARGGRVDGHSRLSSIEGEGASDFLRFELTDDERFFRSLSFEKGAKCEFKADARPRTIAVEAETVRASSFPDSSRISGVEALGNCRMSFDAPPDPGGHLHAADLRLAFDREGEIVNWAASGDVRMSLEGKDGRRRDLGGEAIAYSGKSGLLTVTSQEAGVSRLESDDSWIEAPVISLETRSGDTGASGGVKCLLKPRSAGAPVGFFSKDAPVFVNCRTMKSSGDEGRLHFEGQVKLWQDTGVVQAEELDILEGPGDIRGRGRVNAGFPFRSRGSAEERAVEIGGEEMSFSPADRTVNFKGAGLVRTPDFHLAAGSVAVALVEGKKEVEGLVAGGGVVVSWGLYEGRGSEACYDPEAETLVLTGGPVLVEKGKGASRGDKLTFRLADDKILIENKGQGRSITVVKS
jgi:lipopolysaccharide export system protein LptA